MYHDRANSNTPRAIRPKFDEVHVLALRIVTRLVSTYMIQFEGQDGAEVCTSLWGAVEDTADELRATLSDPPDLDELLIAVKGGILAKKRASKPADQNSPVGENRPLPPYTGHGDPRIIATNILIDAILEAGEKKKSQQSEPETSAASGTPIDAEQPTDPPA